MKPEEEQKAEARYYPGLQIDEDYDFKLKDWRFERIGWVAMVLVVLAALAGLFSIGPLSTTEARDPGGTLAIRYERFQRLETQSNLTIEILPGASRREAELLLQGALTEEIEITVMQPEPTRAELGEQGWLLEFPVSSLPAKIWLTIAPETVGALTSKIALDGQEPVVLPMFVYP